MEFEVTNETGEQIVTGKVIPDKNMDAEFSIDINNSDYSNSKVKTLLHRILSGQNVDVDWDFETQ